MIFYLSFIFIVVFVPFYIKSSIRKKEATSTDQNPILEFSRPVTMMLKLLFFLGIVAICLVIIVLMIIWVEIRKDKYAQRRKKSNDKIEPHHFNDYSADEERRVEHFDNNVLRTAELVSPVPVVDPVTADANRKRGEQEAPTTTSQPSTEVPREVETTSLAKRKSDKQNEGRLASCQRESHQAYVVSTVPLVHLRLFRSYRVRSVVFTRSSKSDYVYVY
ncbi:hypothetical protein RB195_018351 [Necator americanus]|uniref:Uncharacterized protein n=1 Tax=Necator americanus TaxID=51031 RepID=A0ABR1CAZ6_NECAM